MDRVLFQRRCVAINAATSLHAAADRFVRQRAFYVRVERPSLVLGATHRACDRCDRHLLRASIVAGHRPRACRRSSVRSGCAAMQRRHGVDARSLHREHRALGHRHDPFRPRPSRPSRLADPSLGDRLPLSHAGEGDRRSASAAPYRIAGRRPSCADPRARAACGGARWICGVAL